MPPRAIAYAAVGVVVLVAILLAAVWLTARRARRPIPLEEIALPCVRLTEGTGWDVLRTREDLNKISSGRYLNRKSDPILIDAKFRVFETTQVHMKQSGLGLMFSGPRQLDITFQAYERPNCTTSHAKELLVVGMYADEIEEVAALRARIETLHELLEVVQAIDESKPKIRPPE